MAPGFWELGCGQGDMWELLGLHLLVLDSVLCLKFITGQWGGRLLDCLFWLPILGEMGTLFRKTLFRKSAHIPREGLCSVWSPGEKESRKRHWEIWEKHALSWTSKKRESQFPLGLRGAAQGWLQTGSTLELTKGQPSRWVARPSVARRRSVTIHFIVSYLAYLRFSTEKLIFWVKHSLRKLRLFQWFWVFTMDPTPIFCDKPAVRGSEVCHRTDSWQLEGLL